MPPFYLETGPNLIPELRNEFSLVTLLVQKVTNSMTWLLEPVFFSRDVVFKESIFPFKHWSSKSVPIPSSSSNSMFPMQPVIPKSSLHSVSAEFTPTFTIDIATPPDKFPNLVHNSTDLDHSFPTSIDIVQPIVQPPAPPPVPQPLRKSTRPHKAPTYLHDYHCNLASAHVSASASLTQSHDSTASDDSSILYPISSTMSYDKLSTGHKAFALAVSISKELESYAQAILDPRWQDAMKVEIDALQANNTWVMCELPPDKVHIGCKWAYKVKLKAAGFVERYKACGKV